MRGVGAYLGLVQVPRYRIASELDDGRLVVVLPEFPPPMPVSVLYPHSRQLPLRVRAFVQWMRDAFAAPSKGGWMVPDTSRAVRR